MIMQMDEEFFVSNHLRTPIGSTERLQLVEFRPRQVEALPFNVLVPRHPSNRRLTGRGTYSRPVHNPLQDAHVLAESRPDELAILILAEPVHVKHARRLP